MSGTGGRETAEGPARRFDHSHWSAPYPGMESDPGPVFSPPPPGIAVLSCACGRALGIHDMYRAWPPRPAPPVTSSEAFPIPRIVCADCAAAPTVEAEE